MRSTNANRVMTNVRWEQSRERNTYVVDVMEFKNVG